MKKLVGGKAGMFEMPVTKNKELEEYEVLPIT